MMGAQERAARVESRRMLRHDNAQSRVPSYECATTARPHLRPAAGRGRRTRGARQHGLSLAGGREGGTAVTLLCSSRVS